MPKLSKKQTSWIKTQIECSDDELEAQEFLASLPTPEDITIDMMRQLKLNFKGENRRTNLNRTFPRRWLRKNSYSSTICNKY